MATHSSFLAWRIPDRGAWRATVHGIAKSWTVLRLKQLGAQAMKANGLCSLIQRAVHTELSGVLV